MATAPVTAIVDRLGDIKAQIADLKKIEADLVSRLIDNGDEAVDGRFYRATVSQVTKGYTTVKVVARKA